MSNLNSKLYLLPFYIIFLIPLFLLAITIWYFAIDGNLYYCSDKVPILDFEPPFVHQGIYGSTGDYWIANKSIVYFIWIVLVLSIFFIPLYLTKLINKERRSLSK